MRPLLATNTVPPRRAATPPLGEQPMAHFHHEHITIINEREVRYYSDHFAGLLVLANIAPSPAIPADAPIDIDIGELHDALLNSTGVNLPIHNIARFLHSYVLVAHTKEEGTTILDVPLIHVGDYDLAITPWTSTYGSHRMDVDDILPPLPLTPTRHPRSPENLQALGLVISGTPPHLFAMYWMLLPRIFTNICQFHDVYEDRSDYSLRANTFAPPGAIPRVAYVAIRKQVAGRNVLYMWALWIQVIPYPPSHPVAFQYNEDVPSV
ncbi:hypothetical protein PVAP13_1KG199700 [Panicum virgatum]|uniref:Uncharacterized protein n=1 Tax=Panicum virgatum TaxID=38727 RepID=A0A8T0X7X7_PANVG|nr:hypothetical protein PVAP13_1KG199700 [Panicum virgatum]